MLDYYDKKGNRISFMEWGRLFEDHEYRQIDHTTFPNGDYVSTVWLGLDHGFGGGLKIFETMSFENGDWNVCRRYATEEEAREGHKEVVGIVEARHELRSKGRV